MLPSYVLPAPSFTVQLMTVYSSTGGNPKNPATGSVKTTTIVPSYIGNQWVYNNGVAVEKVGSVDGLLPGQHWYNEGGVWVLLRGASEAVTAGEARPAFFSQQAAPATIRSLSAVPSTTAAPALFRARSRTTKPSACSPETT